jgi:hypothetical protein
MIVKCSHCKQIISENDFNQHECDLPLTSSKRIEVIYFRDDSYKNKKLMTGLGIDGVLYTFEVVPRKPIPMIMPLNRRNVTTFNQNEETTTREQNRFS